MANHKSARKQHRQSLAGRHRNRQHRSRLRTAIKQLKLAMAEGDVAQAQALLPETLSLYDRSAKLGAVHHNAAARAKSRLTRAFNRAAAGS